MNRPVHFEIQVDDIERAKKFYTDSFGWGWHDWTAMTGTPYWGILTAPMEADGTPSKEPGINGGLLKRPCPAPKPEQGTNAYVVTMQVDNYDAIHEKIMAAGGIVALPKFAFPGMAWQGYYIDTEGNTFGLHQADKNAK